MKALYTLLISVGIASGRPSSSSYFVHLQVDNLFCFDPHHKRATIPLRPPTQAPEREQERGTPISRTTPERGVSPLVIIVRRRHLRPVTRVHLLFRIQLLPHP